MPGRGRSSHARRRASLGASREQHHGEQQTALRRIGVGIATARGELADDRCFAAAQTMLMTAHDWGRYTAEKTHSERTAADESRISSAYAEVRETFLKRCVRRKQA